MRMSKGGYTLSGVHCPGVGVGTVHLSRGPHNTTFAIKILLTLKPMFPVSSDHFLGSRGLYGHWLVTWHNCGVLISRKNTDIDAQIWPNNFAVPKIPPLKRKRERSRVVSRVHLEYLVPTKSLETLASKTSVQARQFGFYRTIVNVLNHFQEKQYVVCH